MCYQLPSPPTTLFLETCPSDHIVCFSCNQSLVKKTCPVCRVNIQGGIKNHHVKTLLVAVQEASLFKCINRDCKKVLLDYSKTFHHNRLCKFKPCECPKLECKKTFVWLPSGPKDYCTDHAVSIKPKDESRWIFALFLNRIYNPDNSKVRYHNYFKSLLLLNNKPPQNQKGETLQKLSCKIFKENACLYLSIVCLDHSKFPLPKNARLIGKIKFYISCRINCGHGPFMFGKIIKPLFQDQHCPKSNTLCLTPELLAKFEQKSRFMSCVECACSEQHLHFTIDIID